MDTASSNRVVISKALATKLRLKLGDKIDTYYIQDDIRARRLQIVGIYQTNFSEYDNLFLLTDLYLVNRLNNWEPGQVSGAPRVQRQGNHHAAEIVAHQRIERRSIYSRPQIFCISGRCLCC